MAGLATILVLVSVFLSVNSSTYERNYKKNDKANVLSAEATPTLPLDLIVITETPIPTPTPTVTPIPSPTPTPTVSPIQPVTVSEIDNWFNQYSNQYGISKELLQKIAWCESHYNPTSINGPYVGMFQFTESAWRGSRARMGLNQNQDLRNNAEEAIKTAAFKISQDGTTAWYNCAR